jgi:arsenite methyltransferase
MVTVLQSDLKQKVCEAYSGVARIPAAKHPFPVGRAFAESLGYSPDLLDGLPAMAVEAFAVVSNVSLFAELPTGATVLDLGCGAGLDSLIAARRVGAAGKVLAIDFSETMIQRARQAANQSAISNVTFHRADAEQLPIESASVDVALVNGIFNLNPSRSAIFRELARVIRSDGRVYAAELVLASVLPDNQNEADWFA